MAFGAQRLLIGFIAILIVLSIVGYGFLYMEISKVNRGLEKTSEKVNSVGESVDALRAEVASLRNEAVTKESLEGLKSEIEALSSQLDALRNSAATVKDLESLAAKVAELSSQLEVLSTRIEEAGRTSEEAIKTVEELRASLEEVKRELSKVSESILFPAEIVDGTGDVVIVPARPERIVSMAPSVTETLYYVGALDKLVGVDDYSDWPASVAEAREKGEIASIGGFWNPSVEAILSLNPDLVIGVASAPPHRQVKQLLEAYGIPVILLPNESLDDVKKSLIIVGKATGNVVEAYEALISFEASVSAARALLGGAEGVKVAVAVWLEPLFVVGWGNWEHDIIESLGAVNVYGDESDEKLMGWPMVSVESLLERAPEVLIVTGHQGITAEDVISWLESQLGDAAYEIPAVKEGRVYVIQGAYADVFARPSPRTALAVYVLLAILSPQSLGLGVNDVPSNVNPSTLNVIDLLKERVPEKVYEFLGEALS
ncbi:MAG: helical backbone metal receptor [Desulfurococcales archaeon]|nr:helical backbone metal receptor [Desulfurococcales archaeon]